MGVELDTLEIQIHSSADEASAGIDRLTNALNQLKSVAKGGAGLTAVANQLSKLNSALSSIQVNEGRIKGLNQALKPLKALADLKGVKLSSSIATQMKAIGEAANTLDETCAQRLAAVGNGLSALAGAKDIHLSSSIANQLKAIGEAAQGVNHTDLAGLGQKTMQLKEALLPLTELGKSSFSGMVKSLEKIGDITETLGNVETMQKFGDSVQEVARKMEPLVNQATKVYVALKWLPDVVNKIANSNEKMSLTFIRSAKNVNIFGTSIKSLGIRSAIKDFSAFAQRVYGVMKNWVTESNNYIENLNLFTVAMGDTANQAYAYAERVRDALGIDPSEWMRNQGVFKQITSGFGVVEEKANLMSKVLTQVGYDISSFFNISIEESMQKVQSGISGELEPLRRLGYALDQATLQQIAYNHGINQSISTMTQAEKSQLRFVAIMEQSKNVMGDMARTVMTPANAMRILQQQVTQLSRALGNILIPILTTILPYIQAFVMVLTEAAQAIANLFGFQLPTIDYSGADLSGVSQGADTATDSLENATEAAKDLKQYTLGFDELNILSPVQDTAVSGSPGLGGGDLGLDLSEYDYDFLGEIENKAKEIAEKIKKFFKDWEGAIKSVGAALLAAFAAKKLISGINNLASSLKRLKDNGLVGVSKAILGSAGLVAAFVGGKNAAVEFYKVLNGEGNLGSALVSLGVSVAGIGAAFWAWGIPGAIVGTVTALVGAFYGLWEYQNELSQKIMSEQFYDGLGISIETLTARVSAAAEPVLQFTSEMASLSEQSNQYKVSLGEVANGLNNYINNVIYAGTVTAEQKEKINEQIGLLVQNLRDKLAVDSDQIFQTFAHLSQQTAQDLGMSVSEMSGILEDFQKRFGDTTQETQNRINEILEEVSQSGWTDELRAEMDNLYGYLSDVSANSSELVRQYRSSLSSATDIDFVNADATREAMEGMLTSASNALGELDRLRDQELSNLETMKQNLNAMLDHGLISTEEYQEKMAGFMQMEGALTKAFEAQKAEIQEEVSSVMNQISQNMGEEFQKLVTGEASPMLEGLKGMTDIPASTLEAIYADAARNADQVIYQPVKDVLNKFKGEESLSFLYDAGSGVVNGLTKGIDDTKQEYIDSINQMAEDGLLSYKGMLGIHSPSTVFYDFGYDTVLGLKNGISDNAHLVTGALESLTGQMTEAMTQVAQQMASAFKEALLQAVQALSMDTAWSQNIVNTLLSAIFTPGGMGMMGGGMMGSMGMGGMAGDSYTPYVTAFAENLLAVMNEILPPQMQQGALAAVNGFVEGIELHTPLASEAMRVLVEEGKGILPTFDQAMDAKNAPSKEMEKRGLWAMQGLEKAIKENTPLVTDQIKELSRQIIELMDKLVADVRSRVESILAEVERAKAAIQELSSLSVSGSFSVNAQVRGFASGGFPKEGQMFLARESGPELVGSIGGRSAVANNDQIVEAVSIGVYQAMVSAMNRGANTGESITVHVTLDGEEIYQNQEEIRRNKGYSFGMGAFAR